MPLNKFDERVRTHAHDLWLAEGRPHGRNDEFWSRALAAVSILVDRENLIRNEVNRPSPPSGTPPWRADDFWFKPERSCRVDACRD